MLTTNNKLVGKLVITGEIEVLTGLAIGGSNTSVEIGGMDNPVIKNHRGKPYIPGSSLKGKMRSLLAKVAGSLDIAGDVDLLKKENSPYSQLARVFGFGANEAKGYSENSGAYLQIRDSFLLEPKGETTEEKTENTINRVTGEANPRSLERVVPGTRFELEMVLDLYNDNLTDKHIKLILLAIDLLEQDYLGGGGSRGNGRIKFDKMNAQAFLVSGNVLEGGEICPFDREYKFK